MDVIRQFDRNFFYQGYELDVEFGYEIGRTG